MIGAVLAAVFAAVRELDDKQRFERVCAAVYWHGRAGEQAAAAKGVGMLPHDLIDALATVRSSLT